MFVAKPKRLALTLLCSLAVVLALTSSAEAAQHRDHVVIHRMIKKRADNPFLGIFGGDNSNNAGSVGAANDPPTDNASSSSVASAASSSVAASSSASASASQSVSASVLSAVRGFFHYQQYQYVP